jgi:hypothetical protein
MAEASALRDPSGASLLQEIQEKHRKVSLRKVNYVLWSVITLVALLSYGISPGIILLLVVAWLTGFVLAPFDQKRKTVSLQYELDVKAQQEYSQLSAAIRTFASSGRIERVTAQKSGLDRKYNCGMPRAIRSSNVRAQLAAPPFFQVNLPVWRLGTGVQDIYFFPDRILVFQGSQVGGVSYARLKASATDYDVTAPAVVPSDATIVGRTWKYTNKAGGPDRRFSYNPQIPVIQCAEVDLESDGGMSIVLQTSNMAKGHRLADQLTEYSRYISTQPGKG